MQELLGMWDVWPPASLSCPLSSEDSRLDNELHFWETSRPYPCFCRPCPHSRLRGEKSVFLSPAWATLKELPEMPCVCSVGGVPVYQIWTSSWDLDMIQKDLPWSCCLLCCHLLPFPSMRYVAPYIKYSNTHTLLYSRWPHNNLPRAYLSHIKVKTRPLCAFASSYHHTLIW